MYDFVENVRDVVNKDREVPKPETKLETKPETKLETKPETKPETGQITPKDDHGHHRAIVFGSAVAFIIVNIWFSKLIFKLVLVTLNEFLY